MDYETKQKIIDDIQSRMSKQAELSKELVAASKAGDFEKAKEIRTKMMELNK